MSLRALAPLFVLLGACQQRAPAPEVATVVAASAEPRTAEAPSAAPPPSASAKAPAPSGTAFVRRPPHSTNSDADGVDECTQVGGNYFSCRGALAEEKDPVLKRYLYRIAQGYAAGIADYRHDGPAEQGSLPHAEVPYMCDPSKSCKARNVHGELNHPTSCLARTYAEVLMNNGAAARAAHAKACKCDAKEAAFPGYNHTAFICDAAGKPAFIAPKMKDDEGADIIACARCEPKQGPAACEREIARLASADPALSKHIAEKQVRRCQTANDGPNEW